MRRLACASVLLGSTCALLSLPRDARAAPKQAGSNLQLGIITPDSSAIGDRMSLDVTFRAPAEGDIERHTVADGGRVRRDDPELEVAPRLLRCGARVTRKTQQGASGAEEHAGASQPSHSTVSLG